MVMIPIDCGVEQLSVSVMAGHTHVTGALPPFF